jgi:hypothetical protein
MKSKMSNHQSKHWIQKLFGLTLKSVAHGGTSRFWVCPKCDKRFKVGGEVIK